MSIKINAFWLTKVKTPRQAIMGRHQLLNNLPSCVAVMLLLSLIVSGCTNSSQPTQTSATESPASVLRVSGSGTALPLVQKLAQAYQQKHPEIKFKFESGTNSGGAIQGVLKGTLDIAVANRPLSGTEAKEAIEYHAFARDAVGFVVNQPSPVENISSQQVRDIYGGKLTNWQQLGGKPAPIIVLDRDPDESARKLVLVPLMQGQPVKAQTVVLSKAKEMVKALESTPNALGYSSVGLLQIMPTEKLQLLKLDGVLPSAQALAQDKYPWYLTFGLIHRRNPPPEIQSFVSFIRKEGSQVLKEYGYGVAKP